MGVLTHDLTRLRNEILALRTARRGLIHDLERETEDRRADVSQMLDDFSKGLGDVARRTKANRLGSLSNLKGTVSDILTGVRTDLSGIRRAWNVLGAPPRRAGKEPETQAKMETGAGAEGRRSEKGSKSPVAHAGGEKPLRRKRKH